MTGETPDDTAPGRTAVRVHFLARMDEAGMVRPRAMTAEAFGRMRDRLAEWLAYLPAEALDTLADTAISIGGGKAHTEWPAEATIRHLAGAMMKPPPEHARIITSWLASVEGPRARDGGWLVELYRHLLQRPLPPSDYDRAKIVAAAEENRRERARLRQAGDDLTDRERQWLDAYAADEARALALVDAGDERRRAAAIEARVA